MNKITEDYVSFETAKLLKEKGFNEETEGYYPIKGDATGRLMFSSEYNHNHSQVQISAPTLQMAMKWLREVHKIFVDVDYNSDEFKDSPYFSLITNMNTNNYFKGRGLPQEKSTYEEACEAAIRYCLENLI